MGRAKLNAVSPSHRRAPDSSTAQLRNGKLPGLQLLRFAAAFAVVLFHIGSGYQIEFGNSYNPFYFGSAGVDVFFVLSGFIIAMTTDPARGSWYFCRRRVVRVVPLYWILTLGIAAIGLVLPSLLNSTSVTPEALLKSLFFIPYERSNGAIQPLLFLGWTLNYEMFFYAIYAACLLAGWKSPLAPVTIVVSLVVAGQVLPFEGTIWRFYSNPIMIEFALGVGICIIYNRFPNWFGGRAIVCIGAAVATYVALPLIPGAPWLLTSALPAALFVAAFVSFNPGRSRLIGLLVLCGNASYSLYLSHPYIIQLLSEFAPLELSVAPQILLGAGASSLCIAASVIIYRFLELPMAALFSNSSSSYTGIQKAWSK
ncbi:MAG: acyltransferase family protein [Paracoccus sp. (in: a-proteobacteria)]|uniref:acyltransferase family protein n=1 Tax=Paracoccus sp. TaxID=267 RepID=UPI0040580F1B